MVHHESDVEAIERVISDIETGFNTNDADRLVAHFAQNALVLDVAGHLTSSRDAFLDATRAGLSGTFHDQYARYELVNVVFPRSDVAVAHKRAEAVTADGEPLDVGHAMISLYVLIKEGGRWWVTARQDTMVREPI